MPSVDAVSSPTSSRALRRQELLCSASARGLARHTEVDFVGHSRAHRAFCKQPFYTPWFHVDIDYDDFPQWRGAADAIAIRYRHSDDAVWRAQLPPTPLARALYCALEQYRCQYCFDFSHYQSVQNNLSKRFAKWCSDCLEDAFMETELGVVFYSLLLSMRVHLTGMPMDAHSEDVTEATRAQIMPQLSAEINALKRERKNPDAFVKAARSMANFLVDFETQLEKKQSANNREPSRKLGLSIEQRDLDQVTELDEAGGQSALQDAFANSDMWMDRMAAYRVYCDDYDQVVDASDLVASSRQRGLRQQLNQLVQAQGLNFTALAQRWRHALMVSNKPYWRGGEEEGLIDPRRLSSIVSSPLATSIFRQAEYQDQMQTSVSVLLDNSGSLKRLNYEAIVVMVDALLRSLEMAGAEVELLGFTTHNVSGGRAYQRWRREGEAENPGRLAELRHIVYKPFDKRYRQAQYSIASLMSPNYFRESVDGEALLFAANRLRDHGADRKILLVISDGLPMETGTALGNGVQYLHEHLFSVTQSLQSSPDIELFGLGVGYDLSPWYRNALQMPMDQVLKNAIFDDLLQALAAPQNGLRLNAGERRR